MRVLVCGAESSSVSEHLTGYQRWAAMRGMVIEKLLGADTIEYCSSVSKLSAEQQYDVGIFIVSPYILLRQRQLVQKVVTNCSYTLVEVLWETTRLPAEWGFLSELFDGAIVGSRFCEELVLESKLFDQDHVFYVPYVVTPRHTKTVEERMKQDTFNVLFVGQNTIRKGLADAVTSFIIALGELKDCSLIVKTDQIGSSISHNVDTMVKSILTLNRGDVFRAQISVCDSYITTEQLDNLYEESALNLFPSRGEGFGLPLVEALIHGIPSVYIPFSAAAEVADFSCNYPVDYVLDIAYGMRRFGYSRDQYYAVPKMSSLVSALENAYSLWKTQRYRYFSRCVDSRKKLMKLFPESAALKAMEKALEPITTEVCR